MFLGTVSVECPRVPPSPLLPVVRRAPPSSLLSCLSAPSFSNRSSVPRGQNLLGSGLLPNFPSFPLRSVPNSSSSLVSHKISSRRSFHTINPNINPVHQSDTDCASLAVRTNSLCCLRALPPPHRDYQQQLGDAGLHCEPNGTVD